MPHPTPRKDDRNHNTIIVNRIIGQARRWYSASLNLFGAAKGITPGSDRATALFPFGKMLHLIKSAFQRGHVSRDNLGQVLHFRSLHCMDQDMLQQLDAEDANPSGGSTV